MHLTDLLYVVHTVQQVKLSPLGCAQGAKNWVIEKFAAGPKFFFAARHQVVHLSNLGANFSEYLLYGNASRLGHARGFPAGGEIAEFQNNERAHPLLPSLSVGQRLPGLRDTSESL